MVRSVATDSKAFFLISTCKFNPTDTGPQMIEFVCSSRTQTKEWMERISKTAEDFKRHNPNWGVNFQRKKSDATEEDVDGEDQSKEAVEMTQQQTLEVYLGGLLEKMRNNCDNNRKLMHLVESTLEKAGSELSDELRHHFEKERSEPLNCRAYHRSGSAQHNLGRARFKGEAPLSASKLVSDPLQTSWPVVESTPTPADAQATIGGVADSSQSQSQQHIGWLSNELAKSMEEVASLQTELTELRVKLAQTDCSHPQPPLSKVASSTRLSVPDPTTAGTVSASAVLTLPTCSPSPTKRRGRRAFSHSSFRQALRNEILVTKEADVDGDDDDGSSMDEGLNLSADGLELDAQLQGSFI